MNWEITNKATYFSQRLYDMLFNDYESHCAETNWKSCLKPSEIPSDASLGSVVVNPFPSRRKSHLIVGNRLLATPAGSQETVVVEREREREEEGRRRTRKKRELRVTDQRE
jgi:hypothetical protein